MGRTASDRGSCGLGLCGLPVPGKKVSVYHLYRVDADAFSGDHAFSISGVKPGGVMNTHWAVILPAVFSTFPVFLIYRGFCGIPRGCWRRKDRRGRRMVSVLADRASFVFRRDSFGNGAGISGILESD